MDRGELALNARSETAPAGCAMRWPRRSAGACNRARICAIGFADRASSPSGIGRSSSGAARCARTEFAATRAVDQCRHRMAGIDKHVRGSLRPARRRGGGLRGADRAWRWSIGVQLVLIGRLSLGASAAGVTGCSFQMKILRRDGAGPAALIGRRRGALAAQISHETEGAHGSPASGTTLAFLGGFGVSVIWVFSDQRRRCPVCLRRLERPVTFGSWASMFEPVTTEFVCEEGHGRLSLAESESPARRSLGRNRRFLRGAVRKAMNGHR